MKEIIVKTWNDDVVNFVAKYGHDKEGDEYISNLGTKIAEVDWKADETPDSFSVRIDMLKSFETETERFVNTRLVWEFVQKLKTELKKNEWQPPKTVDRGYDWYKDYE